MKLFRKAGGTGECLYCGPSDWEVWYWLEGEEELVFCSDCLWNWGCNGGVPADVKLLLSQLVKVSSFISDAYTLPMVQVV